MARHETKTILRGRERAQRRRQHMTERRSATPIVGLRRATKVYPGGHVALDRVSLRVDRGEFVFLVGPTGCGKSTLIKLLIRELQPTEGEVLIAGRDIADKTKSLPDQLSGGEQQRLAVARAFVNHPPLLLADEPTGNLDPATSVGIMQTLYRINKTGTTVVVVTHDREMVDKMRRRVIALDSGRVVRDQSAGMYTDDESTSEFATRL